MTTVVAHVSDTHFGGPDQARVRAEAVLAHLLAMDPLPDLLVVTGDVADHGLPAEYAEARDVLRAWTGPMIVGPGNHDVREAFARGLLGAVADPAGPIVQVLDLEAVRVVMLDSLVPARAGVRIDHGELTSEALVALEDLLGADGRPTFVGLHHPPVELGLGLMSPILLHDPDPFGEVIARHPHVVALLVGHAHTACATTFAGRPVLVGGGCASTVPLDAEQLPVVWEGAPPSFALHLLDDDGHLTSHWRSL